MKMNNDRVDILFVEDNEYEAKLAIHSLKKHNLSNNLLHLKDGQQAIDYIFGSGPYADRDLSQTPKLILLDINLPKVNGMEILTMIKTDERTKLIPVVILTSSCESSDVTTGYALGANSYIVKPVEYECFNKTVIDLGIYWSVYNVQVPSAIQPLCPSIEGMEHGV